MGVLGHKVFEPLVKATVVTTEPEPVKETPLLHFETKRVQAIGCVVADGFVVCKGSRIASSIAKSCPSNVVEFRQKFSSRIIDDVLTEDVLLPSPSAAAPLLAAPLETVRLLGKPLKVWSWDRWKSELK